MIKFLNPIDVLTVLACYTTLEPGIQWTEMGHKGKQAGLQFKAGEDVWTSAVGKSRGEELAYTNLNPHFKDTIFGELVNKYDMSRARLMWVNSYACYSVHADTTPRIHIPIITNPECYFVFKKGSLHHMPTGLSYWVDTRLHHTFMNCSDQPRLHLVGVVKS